MESDGVVGTQLILRTVVARRGPIGRSGSIERAGAFGYIDLGGGRSGGAVRDRGRNSRRETAGASGEAIDTAISSGEEQGISRRCGVSARSECPVATPKAAEVALRIWHLPSQAIAGLALFTQCAANMEGYSAYNPWGRAPRRRTKSWRNRIAMARERRMLGPGKRIIRASGGKIESPDAKPRIPVAQVSSDARTGSLP